MGYYTTDMAKDYTTQMFNELFGRDPAQAGLDYWSKYLTTKDSPYSKSSFTSALLAGASGADLDYYNKNQINDDFKELFGRDAADAGLTYYNDALKDSKSGVTYDNLNQTILNGAQADDLTAYNTKTNSSSSGSNNTSTQTTTGTSSTGTTSTGTSSTKTLPVTLPEVSLDTVEAYVPSESDTVEGRLNGLLAANSSYLTAARESGERTAQARGLLNSSLAGEASQKAAIEAALPIAQQDSESLISTAADQNLVNSKAYQSAQLSSQEAAQQAVLNEQQNQAAADLSAQESEQELTLDEQQQEGANYRAQLELEFNKTISDMELASNEKTSLASSIETLGDSFQAKLAGIQVASDITSTEKTNAIADLQDAYRANLESLGSIYGVEISWSGFESTDISEDRTSTADDSKNTVVVKESTENDNRNYR